jgi:hypothetical protein
MRRTTTHPTRGVSVGLILVRELDLAPGPQRLGGDSQQYPVVYD